MEDEFIKSKSIGKGIADIDEDFILCEEPMSRLVFHAQIHDGGIRGKIIRQRRESKEDSWAPDQAIDIRTLGKKESINLDLKTEAVDNLYSAIVKLADILKERGVEYGENRYAVVDPDSVIVTDKNKITYIKKIIEAGFDKSVWETIVEANPTLIKELSHAKIQDEKQNVVKELEQRLDSDNYAETKGNNSWQSWIYRNNWLFGANYKKPIEKVKINITGIMPDYLFPTLDGFVDILEIKLPVDKVIIEDKDHAGSWRWTAEANSAVGQVINYLCEIDRLRFEIEKAVKDNYDYEISLLRPRAYILIGNNSGWSGKKREGLRKMNYALHGIEVITYQDLLDRGTQSINIKL